MGDELFKRQWAVTVNTTRTTELDVYFKVEKSLKDEPNKCELHLFNLSEEHRAAIEELNPPTKPGLSALSSSKEKLAARKQATRGIPVKIEAGYGESPDDLPLIWLGDLRTAESVKQKSDWITVLSSGDGEKAYQNARVVVSYGPQTPVATALRAIVKALDIGEGNLASVIASVQRKGIGRLFPQGTAIVGSAAEELTAFCKSADLEWSIQDGALQIINRGLALKQSAILVSPDTGMLDSPTVDVDGILTVKTLMIPEVRPGRLIVVDSARIKGNYRIERATWTGDSAAEEWGIEMQASRY